jgi:hypothetical protein
VDWVYSEVRLRCRRDWIRTSDLLNPHLLGQGRSQPPNVTNASLLETYGFHTSHSLHGFQRRINQLSTFSRLFPAQACPHRDYANGPARAYPLLKIRAFFYSGRSFLRASSYDSNLRRWSREGSPLRSSRRNCSASWRYGNPTRSRVARGGARPGVELAMQAAGPASTKSFWRYVKSRDELTETAREDLF